MTNTNSNGKETSSLETSSNQESVNPSINPPQSPSPRSLFYTQEVDTFEPGLLVTSVGVMAVGLGFDWPWIGFSGALMALFLSLKIIFPAIKTWLSQYLTSQERKTLTALLVFLLAIAGLANYFGIYYLVDSWLDNFKYDEFGSWAEWVGALGQIMIAFLAVYVAWQQYVISKNLTIQQNLITQQQTIDAYFQGISDLALDQNGMLEDWPQERAIAEGRTAAILSSLDSQGKAKIIRFLSKSKLISPLKRDRYLGRPILDGSGGYAEDRVEGIRVINLGVMLVDTDISGQDLRWADLSDISLIRANLSFCDLSKSNLSRAVLYESTLQSSDLKGTCLFYGSVETASPRSRTFAPNYETGAYTGVVIENVNLTDVKNLSDQQRYYCCVWGGEATRKTIPGGCEGIPNLLGR